MKKALFFVIVFFLAFSLFCAPLWANDQAGKVRCLECHVSLPLDPVKLIFHQGVSATCTRCHTTFPCDSRQVENVGFRHPTEVVPTMKIPKDMPLDIKGKMSCFTCHPYHSLHNAPGSTGGVLRRSGGPTFCYTCHEKL